MFSRDAQRSAGLSRAPLRVAAKPERELFGRSHFSDEILMRRTYLVCCGVLFLAAVPLRAADKPPTEEDYYKILRYDVAEGRGAGGRRHRVHARRPARRRHAPRRNLDGRTTPSPPTRRRRSSRASPTACTKSSAWPPRAAGSTSRSAATCRASRTATATARPTSSRSSATTGRSAATTTNTPSARASTRTATCGWPCA